MAYRFDGSTGYVAYSAAPFTGYVFGAFTAAALVKRNAVGSLPYLAFTTSGFGTRIGLSLESVMRLNMTGFTDGTVATTSTTVWYLAVTTFAGGAAMPRFHLHDGTSWSHANPLSENATDISAIVGTDKIVVGWDGGTFAGIDVTCAGIKKGSSTDLQVETLSPTSFPSWQAFGFDWLTRFDAVGTRTNLANLGTGDETARVDTSLVTDPPGFGAAAKGSFLPFM